MNLKKQSQVALLFFLCLTFYNCKSSKTTMEEAQVETVQTVEKESTPKVNERKYIVNSNGDTLDIIIKSEEEWKKSLSKEEFYVIRQKGTERAFTGDLWDNKKDGMYICKACNIQLFNSGTKFESGTGWPSFYKPTDKKLIKEATDYDLGYARTEVMCARCGGHLGHVFDDGPPPTGLRYCINSVSLSFIEAKN
jgi:peptide-methionine (R)-S-oxide reductase